MSDECCCEQKSIFSVMFGDDCDEVQSVSVCTEVWYV